MGKSSGKQIVTQGVDPGSQGYINQLRQRGRGAADAAMGGGPLFTGPISQEQIQQAMSPYLSNVVDATRGEFDFLRGQANMGVNQQATGAGAFGGSRHGVLAGTRLGEIDRAQGSQIANLLQQGYGQALNFAEHQRQLQQQQMQEPLFRQQQALNFMNMGMGPVGTQTVQTGQAGNNPFGSALGGAAAGSAFGPLGTAIGGGIGLLGGLFG